MSLGKENQMRRRIDPFAWEDMNGSIHFELLKLMAHFELEDTPANRKAVLGVFERAYASAGKEGAIIYREEPPAGYVPGE